MDRPKEDDRELIQFKELYKSNAPMLIFYAGKYNSYADGTLKIKGGKFTGRSLIASDDLYTEQANVTIESADFSGVDRLFSNSTSTKKPTVTIAETSTQPQTTSKEFITDISQQVTFLNEKQGDVTAMTILDAIFNSCQKHIRQYYRLIDTDMYTYIDAAMHIMDACHFFNEKQMQEYYQFCASQTINRFSYAL